MAGPTLKVDWISLVLAVLLTQSAARVLVGALAAGLSDRASVLAVSPADSLIWLAMSLLDDLVLAVYRYRRPVS